MHTGDSSTFAALVRVFRLAFAWMIDALKVRRSVAQKSPRDPYEADRRAGWRDLRVSAGGYTLSAPRNPRAA
jgi:hypothetical protein